VLVKETEELKKTVAKELEIPDPPKQKAVAILEFPTSEDDSEDSGEDCSEVYIWIPR
tara:strand:+ start:230 stop:400 length:171 start_codon:yes stop_codon:yes gene_type:complete